MKNTIKAFGLIVLSIAIGFSFIACGGGDGDDNDGTLTSSSGKLTITGLSSYIGNYIEAATSYEYDKVHLFAAKSINPSKEEKTLEKINGDSVTLNVWEIIEEGTGTKAKEYKGNEKRMFSVYLYNKEKPLSANDGFIKEGHLEVTFSNNIASGEFEEGSPQY